MCIVWTPDIESVLENIRVNSVLMSNQHKKRYLYLKYLLNYFRLPVIVVSGLNSVFSVGLQPYMKQDIISVMTCLLSLICGIIGSIELFLAIQTQMENELLTSKDYYLLSIDIFKILSLHPDNRCVDGRAFLDDKYGTYVKLIENSNVIVKKISDKLAPIPGKILSAADGAISPEVWGACTGQIDDVVTQPSITSGSDVDESAV